LSRHIKQHETTHREVQLRGCRNADICYSIRCADANGSGQDCSEATYCLHYLWRRSSPFVASSHSQSSFQQVTKHAALAFSCGLKHLQPLLPRPRPRSQQPPIVDTKPLIFRTPPSSSGRPAPRAVGEEDMTVRTQFQMNNKTKKRLTTINKDTTALKIRMEQFFLSEASP
jgi:hypothetical protein